MSDASIRAITFNLVPADSIDWDSVQDVAAPDNEGPTMFGPSPGQLSTGVSNILSQLAQILMIAAALLPRANNPEESDATPPAGRVNHAAPGRSSKQLSGLLEALQKLLHALTPLLEALATSQERSANDRAGELAGKLPMPPDMPISGPSVAEEEPPKFECDDSKCVDGPNDEQGVPDGLDGPAESDDLESPDRLHGAPKSPNGIGNNSFDAPGNPDLQRWKPDIERAAAVTQMDPNLIGGMIWAESRGNPDDPSTNADGTTDLGLMQISQERWERDVVPNLSPEDRARIHRWTGKDASELHMDDDSENIIGGAFEVKQHIASHGDDVVAGLEYYVNGGDPGIGSPTYAQDVLQYKNDLARGATLSDE